jgi:site-specific DNA recombinase
MNNLLPNGSAYYARTSTDEQKEKQTIQSQVSALEAEVQKNGEVLAARYTDDGFSGAILDRPALDKLRADAKEKVFTKLYIYSPDRLARDLMLQLMIVKELKKYEIEVVFLSQKFGNSPADLLLFQMLGAISEFERAQILERTRRGKLHKARSGILIGSIPKFGYDYIPKTDTTLGRYEINPEHAKIVKKVFRLFNSPRVKGVRTLAKELYSAGVKSPSGNPTWAKSTLAKLVADSTYIGVTYFNKHMACEPFKKREGRRSKVNSSRRLRPKKDWIPINVPAIVAPAEFNAAQQKLARNREMSDRNTKYTYLIKGLFFCACGKKMYGYPCHGKPRYKCSDKYARYPLPKNCTRGTVDAGFLDSAIWRAFLRVLDQPEVVTAKINKMSADKRNRQSAFEKEIQKINKELLALKEQEERLLEAYAAKVIDLSQLKSQMETIAENRSFLLTEKKQLDTVVSTFNPQLSLEEVETYFRNVKEKTQNADFELKKQIIGLFAHQVIVDGKETLIKAYLPNPVSTVSPTSWCYERNAYYSFEIKLDLNDPQELIFDDERLESKQTFLAA